MAAITAAQVVTLTDKEAALWIAALGTDASAYGMRTVGATAGAYKKAADQSTNVVALADNDLIAALLGASQQQLRAVDAYVSAGLAAQQFLDALTGICRLANLTNVINLDSFSAYYNIGAGAPWNCLFAPDFAEMYYAYAKAYPSVWNTYFEVLQGATYANALRKLVVGTGQTAGFDIVSAKYAGGFGQINAAGITGSGIVTATGDWRNSDGTIALAVNGTVTVTGNGVFVLTPPSANQLLIRVTTLAAAAGITAGTLYAEAKRPAARTNPPT